ncbi:RNA polymerase sigma-70 factor, ECF subfamily [Actinacidiphila alni]|uniref:RNA polymerase sigma-70 factor, ECF subfamily n=1 Tax=Actinacidiphila alni TaxID=380248 RepID=A0A1I2LR59_9ACTN|nr:sigma factor-like helix-turn-helix DNA-binding protein [Actinacidiphila alni]SFF81755.1 RNA polymerase sigma-70 factor, ECF subfamily [Actinacidiphila alni]
MNVPLDSRPAGACDRTDRRKEMVREALAGLAPGHREVLVRVKYQGESAAQVARALGLPPDTVVARIHLAVEAFAAALAQRGYTA